MDVIILNANSVDRVVIGNDFFCLFLEALRIADD